MRYDLVCVGRTDPQLSMGIIAPNVKLIILADRQDMTFAGSNALPGGDPGGKWNPNRRRLTVSAVIAELARGILAPRIERPCGINKVRRSRRGLCRELRTGGLFGRCGHW